MRSLLTLLLLALSAMLAAPVAAQAKMDGLYVLMTVDGQALPASSPMEEDVMVHDGSLLLTSESQWVMKMTASTRQTPQPTDQWTGGSWSVTGDTLTLTPGPGSKGAAVQRFRWTLEEEGTLRLYDQDGREYRFVKT